MTCITTLPETTVQLFQAHLHDPVGVSKLERALGVTLVVDATGRISLWREYVRG